MNCWCLLGFTFLQIIQSSICNTIELNAVGSKIPLPNFMASLYPCDFHRIKRTREYNNNSVTILIQNNAPFTFYEKSKDAFQGIEISFIRTISERLNLISFFAMDHQDENSICNRRYADILIGGLDRYKQYGNEFQPSKPYFRDDINWCVQAAKNLPKWMNFYIICRDWAFPTLASTSFLIGCAILYYLHRDYYKPLTFHHCHILVLQSMFNLPNHYKPMGFILKLLYIITFACCLVINVTAVAYYTTFQIVPAYWKQSRDTSELIRYGRQLSGQPETLQILQEQNKFPDKFLNKFRVCDTIDDCLKELLLTDKVAVSVSQHYVKNNPSVSFAELTCFDEYPSIYSYFISMFVHENYDQREEVFQLAQRAFESGLFVKWHRDVQFQPKHFVVYQWEPFQIAHMGAAALATLYYLFLTILAFVFEILAFRKVQNPNASMCWILIEKLLNTERYFLTEPLIRH